MEGDQLVPEKREALAEIRKKKSRLTWQYRMKYTAESPPTVPRKCGRDRQFTSEGMRRQLSTLELNPTLAINHARSKSCSCKRERSIDRGDQNGADYLDVDSNLPNKMLQLRSRSQSRSRSRRLKDSAQKKAVKLAEKSHRKRNKDACSGEADTVIASLKPKHLFSAKCSTGKM